MIAQACRPQLRRLVAQQTIRAASTKPDVAAGGIIADFINADKPAKFVKIYHMTTFASLGLFPLALALSPSLMNMPVDLAMGVVFPIHGHIGFNYVISDYVPKPAQGAARGALLGITAITLLGLLKLNVADDGITETVKAMWKDPATQKKK
jgi:succinate dehydrogenase (ubiquinone) membrane anchor subunit